MSRDRTTTVKILEVLGRVAATTGDVIESLLTSPYGASYRMLERRLREVQRRRERRSFSAEARQRFYDTLYRLRRDGLIEKRRTGRGMQWRATQSGKEYARRLREAPVSYPLLRTYPATSSDAELKLIIFDIPEQYRRKRDWLREVLRNFGFVMIQKSVWMGRKKLPEKFISDLKALDLLSYVEILVINKSGTLGKFADI